VNRAPTKLRSLFANPRPVSLGPRLAINSGSLYPANATSGSSKKIFSTASSHSCFPHYPTIRTATPAGFSIQTVQSHDHQPKKRRSGNHRSPHKTSLSLKAPRLGLRFTSITGRCKISNIPRPSEHRALLHSSWCLEFADRPPLARKHFVSTYKEKEEASASSFRFLLRGVFTRLLPRFVACTLRRSVPDAFAGR